VCTAQCREALCVLHSVERHYVCTAQCREALCVYCTVYRGMTIILIVSMNYIFVHLLDNKVLFNTAPIYIYRQNLNTPTL